MKVIIPKYISVVILLMALAIVHNFMNKYFRYQINPNDHQTMDSKDYT